MVVSLSSRTDVGGSTLRHWFHTMSEEDHPEGDPCNGFWNQSGVTPITQPSSQRDP